MGDHGALVDDDTFKVVAEILEGRNSGGKHQRNFWLLRRLLWSDVYSKPMSGSQNSKPMSGGQSTYLRYYRARGSGRERAVRAEELEERVACPTAQADSLGPTNPLRCARKMAHDEERRELLNLVFLQRGVRAAAGGSISAVNLKTGFVKMS